MVVSSKLLAVLLITAAATGEAIPRAVQPDPRVQNLEKFFQYYRCAAPHYTSEYLSVADAYRLDYRVLPAISIRESGCGRGAKHENNVWGFHQENFPSIAKGIEFLAHRLMQHPAYKGKSLREKLFTYNPLAAYPEEVLRIMRQIEAQPLAAQSNRQPAGDRQ